MIRIVIVGLISLVSGIAGLTTLPSNFYVDIDGISVAPAADHICALEAHDDLDFGGYAYCWGSVNTFSKLYPPREVVFVQVVSAPSFSCGVTIDQSVTCWGDFINHDVEGQYTQISAGGYAACGIMTDGTVKCWGTYADDMSHTIDQSLRYVQISCSSTHCCALDTSGIPHCFAVHKNTRLYRNPTVVIEVEENVDVSSEWEIEEEEPVVVGDEPAEPIQFMQISVGASLSCGIAYDSQAIHCWGDLNGHKLSSEPLPGPFKQVSVGDLGVCAIEASDRSSIVCWGRAASLIDGLADYRFDQVKVGGRNLCAVTMNSQLICRGKKEAAMTRTDFVVA